MKFPRGQSEVKPRRGLGFSSTDILLSILVGTMLIVSVGARLDDQPGKTAADKVRHDLGRIVFALQQYQLDNQIYPTSTQGLDALVKWPRGLPQAQNWRQNGYLEHLPFDPWGNPYEYRYPGLNGPFDVYSLGADGATGGEGDDADIDHRAG